MAAAQTVIRMAPMRPATKMATPSAAIQSATLPTAAPESADGTAADSAGKPGAKKPKAKKESPEDALVKLLTGANYQRTPKAIFDAWSYREPK